jgi:hypothetical protein
MIHYKNIYMDWKKIQQKIYPTNNYGLLNDQIWALFSKVPIFVIFCLSDIFAPLTCIVKSFLDGHPFIWHLLID